MLLLRHSQLPFVWTLAALVAFALAQDKVFDCEEPLVIGNFSYDLRTLNTEKVVSRERDSPPSKFRDTVRFNVCADLKEQDGVAKEDQCPSPSRACLTKINLKGSDRITAVISLANSTEDSIEYASLSSPKGLHLTFKGPAYPSSTSSEDVVQSFSLKLLCSTEESEPKFSSYNGQLMEVEWSHTLGCALGFPPGSPPPEKSPSGGEEGGEEEKPHTVGSGVGLFFLLLVIAFIGYFALGAYYNYSTYGASGIDLIPHRDFWREVPYMIRDVFSHLCSTVRPRHSSNRGGYIAV